MTRQQMAMGGLAGIVVLGLLVAVGGSAFGAILVWGLGIAGWVNLLRGSHPRGGARPRFDVTFLEPLGLAPTPSAPPVTARPTPAPAPKVAPAPAPAPKVAPAPAPAPKVAPAPAPAPAAPPKVAPPTVNEAKVRDDRSILEASNAASMPVGPAIAPGGAANDDDQTAGQPHEEDAQQRVFLLNKVRLKLSDYE